MLSSDNNIETIAQLVESAKRYIGVKSEYVKLVYVSFAIAYALAPVVGTVWAFVIVAGVYLLLLILFVIKRRNWIEKPLVHFLSQVFLGK